MFYSALIVVTRSDSESIFQQQFGEYHGDDDCYSIYVDSSTIVRLSGLLQKVSNDDTWAYWGIILRKRAGIDKWIIVCSEENTYLDA